GLPAWGHTVYHATAFMPQLWLIFLFFLRPGKGYSRHTACAGFADLRSDPIRRHPEWAYATRGAGFFVEWRGRGLFSMGERLHTSYDGRRSIDRRFAVFSVKSAIGTGLAKWLRR